VVEKFQQPFFTVSYTALMGLLGLHLRHGIWSLFQSLGLLGEGLRPLVFTAGSLLAAAIATGFIALPWAIYFGVIG
jgi:succinate dehydrogenase / fumarate reductase cytochrome b subunit